MLSIDWSHPQRSFSPRAQSRVTLKGTALRCPSERGGGAGLHVPVGDPGGRDGVDEGRLAGPVTQHHVADQLQGDRVDESAVPPEGAMSSQL